MEQSRQAEEALANMTEEKRLAFEKANDKLFSGAVMNRHERRKYEKLKRRLKVGSE